MPKDAVPEIPAHFEKTTASDFNRGYLSGSEGESGMWQRIRFISGKYPTKLIQIDSIKREFAYDPAFRGNIIRIICQRPQR